MNDTEGITVYRRVPFTYHSLLYKLDNIHLKQTYRGKPFGRSTLRKVQRLNNLDLDHACTYQEEDKKNTYQGIKPVHNEQEDIILEPFQSDTIYNGYPNESHVVKLSPITYDDDSDAASDLSIDTGILDGGSLSSYDITPSDSHAQVDLSIDAGILDGGSLSSYDITPSDSHAQVDNNRKTNTCDDQPGNLKELELVKQKTQVSDGRHNDAFSSRTDGTDTQSASYKTPKTESIEDNPEIDKGNGIVISDVEGSHDRSENIVDYRDGDALDHNSGYGASVESNSYNTDYHTASKLHTNDVGESAEDTVEYNDNMNGSSKTKSDISHSFQDCLPLEDSLKSRNENNKSVIDVTHSDSSFIEDNMADERTHQKSSSFDKYESMNIKEDTTSTPFESNCSPNHNLIDRSNGERSTIDFPKVHGNLADDEIHNMTREVYIDQATIDNVTREYDNGPETNDSVTRKYDYDPETNNYVTREYHNDQAANDYVTSEYDNDQPINENVTREYDNGLATNDYVTREFDIHEATIDNVTREYDIDHEKDDNVTREDNIDQATNDYITREYDNDQERDDNVAKEDENDQERNDCKMREYDNDQPTNNDLPCSIQEHNSISSAKTGMDNFTKTKDDSIYQRGNGPLNLIDQNVSIKSMTAWRESNSSLNVKNNPENNNPTLTRSNRFSSSLPFRYRQNEHFVKEYDNSVGLISDLLNIGSSSKTTKSPLRKSDDRSVGKPMPKMTSYPENPISIPDRSNTIANQSPQCNVTTSERYDTNLSSNNPTRRIVYREERMSTDNEYNIPLVNKETSTYSDSDISEIRNQPHESFSSSFPKRQKSQPNSKDGLSRSVDQNRFRTDWSNIPGKSKNTTEKIIETPLYKEEKEMNEISLATEENDSVLKEIHHKDGENAAENKSIFKKEDKQHLTEDKNALGTTVDLQHVDKYTIAEERREDPRHFESETIDVAKQDTTPTSEPYDSNTLDGDLHLESTDIVCTSVREEVLPSANVGVDNHDTLDTDEKVISPSPVDEEEKIDEAQSDSIKSQEEQNEIVPITIKRLSRPEKPKQGEDRKTTTANNSPFESLLFGGNSSVFSGMFGSKYSESTQKKMAETLANLPAFTESELNCPTCGQKVWGTDKTTTSCSDVLHQTLLKIPSLQTIANKYGLVVRNIAGDGDCMFSAVIDQLRIAGDFRFTKYSLRSTAVDYLREHPHQEDGSHLMCFLSTETWEEYLNRMNRSGEWGDHMILNAITEVIGRNVTVLSTSGNATHLFPHHVPVSDDQNVDSVYLGHISDTHYCSLRPKDWEKIWSVNARMRRITIHLQSLEGKEDQKADFPRSDDGVSDSESDQMETNDASDVIFMTNPPQVDNRTDILKSLAEDVRFVDPVSRIPVMHLSYILKQLLRLNYFMQSSCKPVYSPVSNTDMEMDEIHAQELKTKLIDYSKSRRERMSHTCSYTPQIVFPSRSSYTIVTNELQVSSSPQVENVCPIQMLIDASETHPGYLRLRTINNIAYSHCQYVNSKWYVSDIPVSLTCDNQTEKVKYFTGVKCSFWPDQAHEWVTRHRARQWPRKETIESIRKNGCYIAHQNHPSSFEKEIEFQFVFSQAEKLLINEELTEDMKYCFYVFKALVEFQTKGLDCQILAYLLQTTLFYACESIPPETFRNSCGGSVLFMIDLLLKWFRKRNLPNYFIKDNNMIDHWQMSDVSDICDKIETLRLFPCMVLHFISESHGLTSWLIDSIMASVKRFKEDRNIHFVIENTFNPTTFWFANYRLTSCRDYEGALVELNEACEKNLIWSGESVDLRKFVDEFLLTVNSQKAKTGFKIFFEEEFNINQAGAETEGKLQTSSKTKQSRFTTIGDFIGPEYKGMYVKRAFKSFGDPWLSIDMVMSTLLTDEGKYEEIVDIVRCLIKKCQQDMGSSVVDVSEIEDIELKKQIGKSNHDTTSKTLGRMLSYYNLLRICYTCMGQIQLMSDVIDDYQEVAEKMSSKYYISDVVKIWRKLKCPEKAKEIEDNMQGLFGDENEEDEFGKQFMALVLDASSYR